MMDIRQPEKAPNLFNRNKLNLSKYQTEHAISLPLSEEELKNIEKKLTSNDDSITTIILYVCDSSLKNKVTRQLKVLGKALEDNRTVIDLTFACYAAREGFGILPGIINKNKKISSLTIAAFDISTILLSELKALANEINNNSNLKKLIIDDVLFQSKYVSEFNFKDNRYLTTLAIIDNGTSFGDETATALSQELKGNKTLTELDLNSNEISGRGAEALYQLLITNPGIIKLDLKLNKINEEILKKINAQLEKNASTIANKKQTAVASNTRILSL